MSKAERRRRIKYHDPVVVQRNGFVNSAMANAPDGSGITGMTVEWTRAWAVRKAKELGTTVEDLLPAGDVNE